MDELEEGFKVFARASARQSVLVRTNLRLHPDRPALQDARISPLANLPKPMLMTV
jgi:hypothetical protein